MNCQNQNQLVKSEKFLVLIQKHPFSVHLDPFLSLNFKWLGTLKVYQTPKRRFEILPPKIAIAQVFHLVNSQFSQVGHFRSNLLQDHMPYLPLVEDYRSKQLKVGHFNLKYLPADYPLVSPLFPQKTLFLLIIALPLILIISKSLCTPLLLSIKILCIMMP